MVQEVILCFLYYPSQVSFRVIQKASKIEVIHQDYPYYRSQSQEAPGAFE